MADFTPTWTDWTDPGPFRFWAQKVLPLVYDDSLSYYEVLCKVVAYLNTTIQNVAALGGNVEGLRDAYEQLQQFVNDYFDNLDVQQEINTKLDDMAETGALTTLIEPFINIQISSDVSRWLEDNIKPTAPAIDASLTVSGAGADAKVVGDKITGLSADINNLNSDINNVEEIYINDWVDGYLNASGELQNPTEIDEITSGFIKIYPSEKIYLDLSFGVACAPWGRVFEYDIDKKFLRRNTTTIFGTFGDITYARGNHTISNDAYYIRISISSYKNTTSYGFRLFNASGLYNQRFMDIARSLYVDTSGNRNQINIAAIDNNLYVRVPNRLFVYNWGQAIMTLDFQSEQLFIVPHNSALVLNLNTKAVELKTYAEYALLDVNNILLIYNSNGKAYGQWETYSNTYNSVIKSADSFRTCELVNRQGQINIVTGTSTPENSLIGCRFAKLRGFDIVRISVQITSDNVPVAFHDARLGSGGKVYINGAVVPTTDTTKISDLTFAELQNYDFGVYANSMFENTKIATLEEHIKQAKTLGYNLDIELKENVTQMSEEQLLLMFNIIAKYGMLDNVTWGCYRIASMEYFKNLYSKSKLCYETTTLSTETIDLVSPLCNDVNTVYIYFANSEFLNNFTDELRIYASTHNVKLENGNQSTAINLPLHVEKLDKVECAYIDFPVNKLF